MKIAEMFSTIGRISSLHPNKDIIEVVKTVNSCNHQWREVQNSVPDEPPYINICSLCGIYEDEI